MATPGMGERPYVREEIPGFHQDVYHRGTICETELLNPFSAVGFGPRLRGLGSRPVSAARRSRKAGDRSGRPIISPPRNAAVARGGTAGGRASGVKRGCETSVQFSLLHRALNAFSATLLPVQPMRSNHDLTTAADLKRKVCRRREIQGFRKLSP